MKARQKRATSTARNSGCQCAGHSPAEATGLLHDVLDRLPQGVVMFDADNTLLFANRRYCEIYSLPAERVQPGLNIIDLFTMRLGGTLDAKSERFIRAIDETLRRGEVLTTNLNTADGRTIHCIQTPLPTGGWLATHEDITKQHTAERQIEHMASHDALTDLPNRAAFRIQLENALRFNPRDKLLAVMFMDLDNFKGVNDTLGHQVGDELLKTAAHRLRSCMGDNDMVARFGGDEFVILSMGLEKPSEAAMLATQIRDAILQPFAVFDHEIVVDTSIGIALSPHDGVEAEQLLRHADLALYGAKMSGRGACRFFESEMDDRMMQRRHLELDLRAAFVNGEFELHYQPLINLQTREVSCCEALLRWNHPQRGQVPPDHFISMAEEIGLITRIGEWVIRTACAEAARWPEDVAVAVNVSPVQFHGQNLVQTVAHALASSGLAPVRLELEITEAVLLDQTDETLATLRQLHQLGVRIAMDDFGTGYSSLSYLQKFPFDKIKIDQAFISNLSERGESNAIVRAVTGIASSFHMVTTAEGVETEAQRQVVADLGCTEMQGYLFSAALPAQDISKILTDRQAMRRVA